jgi:heat-inducible transcriptional repressor
VTDLDLSPRQTAILRRVVEEYVASGQPVGSRTLVARGGFGVSPSTVRSELAELEQRGLLTHPHTSAGRVPTARGYRLFVDGLLEHLEPRAPEFPLELGAGRGEVEAALQATTEMLSQLTSLLALVSAPPLASATVRHVEVLLLQPQVVMALVITSTGGVTKRVAVFDAPVDSGLANWAAQYLNEQAAGLELGSHRLNRVLENPDLSPRERTFLDALLPAFGDRGEHEQRLYVGGAAALLVDTPRQGLAAYRDLLDVLEQRAALLEVLREALHPRRVFVRVGQELAHPALHEVALVGAPYGVANRPLGAVSLLGPLRMDYGNAIRSVRAAALELSRFVSELYDER